MIGLTNLQGETVAAHDVVMPIQQQFHPAVKPNCNYMNTVLGYYKLVEVEITDGLVDMEEAIKKVPEEFSPNSIYSLEMTETKAVIIFHCGKSLAGQRG
jgi:hypothetical protein